MNNYTIRPVARLLENIPRPMVTTGELVQIEEKIVKDCSKKSTKTPLTNDEFYLEIINDVKKHLPRKGKILKSRFIWLVDYALRARGFNFTGANHIPAHDNYFYPLQSVKRIYDRAFYHKLAASTTCKTHHEDNGLQSLFYFRVEERPSHTLIGNLQIDENPKRHWQASPVTPVLRQSKNLYLNMLQEAIKTARSRGADKIVFQAGSAAVYAQWNKRCIFKDYKNSAATKQKAKELAEIRNSQFNRIKPGYYAAAAGRPIPDLIASDARQAGCETKNWDAFVYEKNGGELSYCSFFHDKFSQHYFYHFVHEICQRASGSGLDQEIIDVLLRRLDQASDAQDADRVLGTIEALFSILVPGHTASLTKEKIKAIKACWRAEPPKLTGPLGYGELIFTALDDFFLKFGYHDAFLKTYPSILSPTLPPDINSKYNLVGRIFCSPGTQGTLVRRALSKDDTATSKDYWLRVSDCRRDNWRTAEERVMNIFFWYEKILPKLLGQLKLKFKKVRLNAAGLPENLTAAGWLLTDEPEKLDDRFFITF